MIVLSTCVLGERISFAVTVLLAFGVFLSFVSAVMPSASDSVSILIVQLYLLLVQSALFVVISCLAVKLHHLDDVTNPVPASLVSCVQRLEKFVGKKKNVPTNRVNPVISADNDVTTCEDVDSNGEGLAVRNDCSERTKKRSKDSYTVQNCFIQPVKETKTQWTVATTEDACGGVMTWARVVDTFDTFFFRVFSALLFLTCVTTMLVAGLAS